MWQTEGIKIITKILRDKLNVDKVEVKGSMLDPSTIDIYSDVDVAVFMGEVTDNDYNAIISTLSSDICEVFGYETINKDNEDVLRICLENGWRFDISIVYRIKKPSTKKEKENEAYKKVANDFWFLSALALTKIGRNDYLLASHLTLELCQLNIVMQMIERDNIRGTNMHRFGNKERTFMPSFPESNNSEASLNLTTNSVLNIIFQAAEYMDETSTRLIKGCPKKIHILKNICQSYIGS